MGLVVVAQQRINAATNTAPEQSVLLEAGHGLQSSREVQLEVFCAYVTGMMKLVSPHFNFNISPLHVCVRKRSDMANGLYDLKIGTVDHSTHMTATTEFVFDCRQRRSIF